ncbi:hypothetical protein D3C73_1419970 [compost metagenome]
MLVLADIVQRSRVAEARNILVALAVLPGMEGVGHLFDVVQPEVAQHAVFHIAELARVDKQELAAPVALLLVQVKTVGLVLGEEPDAGRNLRVGKELAGQCHHAFHIVLLDQLLADFAFVVGVAAH